VTRVGEVVDVPKAHPKTPDLPALPSASAEAEARFAQECASGDTRVQEGKGVFALVVDAAKRFGMARALKRNRDGTQSMVLKVASRDGGFFVLATTRRPGTPLVPGDAVIWVPVAYDKTFGTRFSDHRAGWIGFVGAKVAPAASGDIEIVERYA
jgi:hypothetical protein